MRIKVHVFCFVLLFFSKAIFSQEILDRIVAIVDDKIILQSELMQYSYSIAIQSGIDPEKEPEKIQQLQQQTLNSLITQKVLLVQARLDSVEVSDAQIDGVLEDRIQQMIQQLGSEERVQEYFGMPLRQVRREFRTEVEEGLLVQRLQEQKNLEIQITRREVEQFYNSQIDSLPSLKESVKIRHILLNVEPNEDAIAAARQKAEDIRKRLLKGEDFAEMAKQFSEDPGSAARGGELGLTQRGDMVKEFEEEAFNLEPGEISEIVQSQFGLHIIQVQRKVGEKVEPRHILIRLQPSESDEESTVVLGKEIKRQLLAGEITFEDAVAKYSKDQNTLAAGGDLGWFEIEQLQIETFKETVAKLDVGDISDPQKTRFGYHIIRLEDKKGARQLSINEDWEQIESWALNMKRQVEFEKWVNEIKQDVYIEVKI
jgi:peptidyl-prolyl cis-trans isomerase SurA